MCTQKSKENYPDYHHLTLLDGEMVIDTVPGSNVPSRRYLVYDLMILNSKSLIVVKTDLCSFVFMQ